MVKNKKALITEKEISSEGLSKIVVYGMQEKKAENIVVLDLRHLKGAVCDYFILCSGNSDAQIDAISDSIEEEVYKGSRQSVWHREGKEFKEWLLLDYVDVVCHIFKKEKRAFYGLEELWGDAKLTQIE